MSIRHNENVIVPVPNDPFKNCKLGRGIYAEVLTSIVQKYSDGFVLAINNEWGTGKTTFVKMWQQHMEDRGFRTLYYNAWENDFEQDVMVALISELESIIKEDDVKVKAVFNKVVKKAAPLAKSLLFSFLKTQIEKQFGGDFAKEALKLTTDEVEKELQTQIDSYNSRKNSITEFKDSLTEFVKKSTDDKPVVFIIDEMDRCRPNYAVEVLEQIKHLFNVPGIVFVLSVDKVQLGHAIRGVYGSDKINADEYLRRFIDVEFSLPKPDRELYTKYLFEYFKFDDFFFAQKRIGYRDFEGDREKFLELSILIFSGGDIPLRVQEKIFAHARIVMNSFNHDNFLFPYLFILLIYLKNIHNELYSMLLKKTISISELSKKFEKLFSDEKDKRRIKQILYTEALLLVFYQNSWIEDIDFNDELISLNDEGTPVLLISSILEPVGRGNLFRFIQDVRGNHVYSNLGIDYLLNRIELTEPLMV